MRFTVYTDYALRTLIYLALHEGRQATIAGIADSYGISQNHLTKVAHQLGRGGFVATTRGKGGGLRLARPATAIGLGELVRFTEPDMALVPCFAPAAIDAPCCIAGACGLPDLLQEAQAAFMTVLDRYTLADAVRRRTELSAMLGLSERAPAPP